MPVRDTMAIKLVQGGRQLNTVVQVEGDPGPRGPDATRTPEKSRSDTNALLGAGRARACAWFREAIS